jgi:glycosyltransferase involved in cell wall biosynthesis
MLLPSPKVSVVIPTCNRAELLRCAISSVLSQTWQDFELLVVDDASSDATPQAVRDFPDPRIHYIRHDERKGGSAARNTGIDCARGQYVAFLDDDDEWLPVKLEKQIKLFEGSPTSLGLVYTGYWIIERENGKVIQQTTPVKRGDLSQEIFVRNWVGGTSSVAIRKACFETVGGFDPALPSFQDYDMWIRLAQRFELAFVAEPLLKYHLHERKIWTNLEALKCGMDILLEKHGQSLPLQRNLARYYLSVGARFCFQGEVQKGRKSLSRAIRLNPFEIRSYAYFLFSLLGAKGFAKANQGKDVLLRPMRPRTRTSMEER